MRFPKLLIVAFSLFLLASFGAQGDGSATFAKAHSGHRDGFIVLLRLRYDLFARWKATGKWPDDKAANAALDGHVKYWDEQVRIGSALLAGGMKGDYWDNVAMIIIDAPNEEAAKAIVNGDPAVKAYVFQAQVRPFDTQWVSTKYFGDQK